MSIKREMELLQKKLEKNKSFWAFMDDVEEIVGDFDDRDAEDSFLLPYGSSPKCESTWKQS